MYVLNYTVSKKVTERNGKLVVLFVEMRAAFDSVGREVMIEYMRRMGVRGGLMVRCEETVLAETVGRVKVENREGSRF